MGRAAGFRAETRLVFAQKHAWFSRRCCRLRPWGRLRRHERAAVQARGNGRCPRKFCMPLAHMERRAACATHRSASCCTDLRSPIPNITPSSDVGVESHGSITRLSQRARTNTSAGAPPRPAAPLVRRLTNPQHRQPRIVRAAPFSRAALAVPRFSARWFPRACCNPSARPFGLVRSRVRTISGLARVRTIHD